MPGFGKAVQDKPPAAVKKCKTISPTLRIAAPKIVLVKKGHQAQGHRISVKLGATKGFKGTGTLTCSVGTVSLFDSRGVALPLPYNLIDGARLSDGLTVFLEASAPSAALNDVTLSLALAGGPDTIAASPVTDTLTAVELKLDLCVYKPAAGGADPAPLAGDRRVTDGRNLHLQTDKLYAGRALLIIHQALPAAYAGSLVLRQNGDHLKVYDYANEVPANGQAAVPLPFSQLNSAIPAAGHKVWVEGASASKALLDAGFQLEISDLHKQEGDKALFTVIKTGFDIGRSRVKATEEPVKMTKAKTLAPGRFLHLQDALDQYGRAKIAVHRAEPSAFTGEFELAVLDAATHLPNAPKVTVYDAETAGGAQANPKRFNQTGAYPPAKGADDLWAQGSTVSGALRDTELCLRISDAEGYADLALFTVASFTQIVATIKSTPANTPGRSAAPLDHVFTNVSLDPDFAVNAPLVLMKRAQPDIALTLTALPAGLPILWEAVRNKDDHKDLGGAKDLPVVTAKANVYTATLATDAKGSFRIRPFIDNNEDDKYSDGEPSIPLNLVLAKVTVVKDNSKGITSNLKSTPSAGWVEIKNGTWPATWPACKAGNGAGMTMELVADIFGGGADGRLGLDKVFGGLVNMLTGNEIELTYVDNTPVAPLPPVTLNVKNRYVLNMAAATGMYNGKPLFNPLDPAPNLLVFPVLDTGRNPGGLGGETAVMGRSGGWDLSVDRPVGQRRTMRCIDSPGRPFLAAHPNNANALLAKIKYVQRFQANFCFWTNVTRNRGSSNDVAERVYSVKRLMNWVVTGNWNVNSAGPVPVLTNTKKHKITVSGKKTLKPIGRAQDNGIEVRPPSGITQAMAWETT